MTRRSWDEWRERFEKHDKRYDRLDSLGANARYWSNTAPDSIRSLMQAVKDGAASAALAQHPSFAKVVEALSTLELHGHMLGLAFDQERDRVKAQIDEERKEAMAQHEAEQAAKKG